MKKKRYLIFESIYINTQNVEDFGSSNGVCGIYKKVKAVEMTRCDVLTN